MVSRGRSDDFVDAVALALVAAGGAAGECEPLHPIFGGIEVDGWGLEHDMATENSAILDGLKAFCPSAKMLASDGFPVGDWKDYY